MAGGKIREEISAGYPVGNKRRAAGTAAFVNGHFRQIGAGEGIRTLDPDLGKVVLYP
jgi:hypothetical protein